MRAAAPPTVSLGLTHERVAGVAPSWRRRAGCGAALLLLLAAICVLGSMQGAHVLRLVRIEVRGRVLDATTGEPVAGVLVVPMWSLTDASRESALTHKRKLETDPARAWRGGISGSDGTFSFPHAVHWCAFESAWSTPPKAWVPPPFYGAEGLLLGRAGHDDVVVGTRAGSWRAEPSDTGATASLEMGDVRFGQ